MDADPAGTEGLACRIRPRDLRCQITNLFPTSVLIIKLKLRLRVDSSGYAPVLSPIKLEKRRDYVGPSGAFYKFCETVKPCHGLWRITPRSSYARASFA